MPTLFSQRGSVFMITNEELIRRSKAGDEQAMSDLILKHKDLVKSIVRKYFLVGADMDDLMQEGMIGLYKAILSYDENSKAKFLTFAKLCISRQVYNAIKINNSQKNQPLNSSLLFGGQGEIEMLDGDDEDDSMIVVALDENSPEAVALKKERLQTFYNSIDKLLDDNEYATLQMYLDGKSYSEIAQKTNKTTKNVDNTLARIRIKLKKEVV